MIKSWSFSRLGDFETCAYRAKLKFLDKVPEPERPLKPGQTEHANDRGTRIHENIEKFIRGEAELCTEALKHFGPYIKSLKQYYEAGKVEMEGEWGFDKDWKPCDYRTAWLRLKCDAVWHQDEESVTIIDYKTGRKFGNEVKHGDQLQLYALCAAIKYPHAKYIDVKLWYIDQPPHPADPSKHNATEEVKTSAKWLYMVKLFNARGKRITEATEFPPNANAYSCQYCAYKDGICPHAHVDPKAMANVYKRKNSKAV